MPCRATFLDLQIRTLRDKSHVLFRIRQTVKGPPIDNNGATLHIDMFGKTCQTDELIMTNTDQQNRQLNRSHTRFLSCRMKLDPLSRKHSPPAPLKLQCGFRAFAQGSPWLPDGCSRRRDRVQSLRPFGCIASTVSWSTLSQKMHHKSILKRKWFSEFMDQLC